MTKKVLAFLISFAVAAGGAVFATDFDVSQLQSFVAQVYSDYAAASFASVYSVMHPLIRETVPEDRYVEFQRQHFAELNLEISNIETGEVTTNPRLPRTLRELLAGEASSEFFGVEISYRVRLESGVKLNQKISKTVYVALADPGDGNKTLYLLWDPTTLEEEEMEDGSH